MLQRKSLASSKYLIALFALFLAASAARQSVAAYYFRQNLPSSLQKAIAWDSGNPVYPAALANLSHLYSETPDPGAVIQLYKSAVRKSPFDAGYISDLAQAHDWAGQTAEALPLFQRAQFLFPSSPEINWKLANFYVRAGKNAEAVSPLKRAFSSQVIANHQIFALCESARLDSSTVLDNILPPEPNSYLSYLNFQAARRNFAAAQQVWDRLQLLHSPFELRDTFPFLDALIKAHEIDRATSAWSSLAARFPALISSPASAANLVTNANFQTDLLDGGFDWRVYPVPGVTVTQDPATPEPSTRSLQINFDGSQNLYYGSVLQLVPVQPRTKYDFSAVSRPASLTTDTGAFLQVSDGYDPGKIFGATEPLTGTAPWSEQKFSFETGPTTRLVTIRVVRAPSQKFDNKIAGAFYTTRISLLPLP